MPVPRRLARLRISEKLSLQRYNGRNMQNPSVILGQIAALRKHNDPKGRGLLARNTTARI
ncbi:hypothetical protein GCM10009645_51500 [Mycolicibacterium poriferae]|uniref:Uncharacterized protein n=1 Tax=Mycolicibacterium poriferae TaxID=39694 RepID=A0A6N4VF17_9MYCO|nr:hypothetical protein MPOR_44510 [Mycolicibacterium poriferae]